VWGAEEDNEAADAYLLCAPPEGEDAAFQSAVELDGAITMDRVEVVAKTHPVMSKG
jgi:hypothetical protein